MINLKEAQGSQLYGLLQEIKYGLKLGIISYEQAQKTAEPIISEMNVRGAVISKAHKKTHNPVRFSNLMH